MFPILLCELRYVSLLWCVSSCADYVYFHSDEIHERGVDLDLLCLLCRRLLRVNSHLRLVLMSATLAAALYQEYFDVGDPPIEVGARRFPVTELFLEDLNRNYGTCLSEKVKKAVKSSKRECDKHFDKRLPPPSPSYVGELLSLAVKIIASIGRGGTSILVFVPGMNEIVAVIEEIGELFIPGLVFTTIPVHSDIPFEEQLAVFSQTKKDECRVIVATNSAESSVTLPALDHVIDLGLCRQIVYNQASHRQMLTLAWISRASATQRAGRTGRIRNGFVYKLYTRDFYDNQMQPFEPGEMLRIPLDSVILTLKGILPREESATQVLLECLEPPSASTIDRSLTSLHESRFISSPDDEGEITTLGSFVSALGTDLLLGSLIGLGIQFGVGPEAILLAGALSFGTKPPWIMSNMLIHGAREFNKKSAQTFVSRCHFDNNLFSEPFAIMNLIWDFKEASNKPKWCWNHNVAIQRIRQLTSSCSSLQRRVADVFNLRSEVLDVESPPRSMPEAKLAILRAIQVWVFHETMVEWAPGQKLKRNEKESLHPEFVIPLKSCSDTITRDHFSDILMKDRHPFEVRDVRMVEQTGVVQPIQPFCGSLCEFSNGFEERMISYAIEKELLAMCFRSNDLFVGFISTDAQLHAGTPVGQILAHRFDYLGTVSAKSIAAKARGISERACGKWSLVALEDNREGLPSFHKFSSEDLGTPQKIKSLDQDLFQAMESFQSKTFYLKVKKRQKSEKFSFTLRVAGQNTEVMSSRDIRDLFSSLEDVQPKAREMRRRQELVFPFVKTGPWKQNPNAGSTVGKFAQPLVDCIPEGARVIAALASSSRRGHIVYLGRRNSDGEEGMGGDEQEEQEEDDFVDMHIDHTVLGGWTKLPQGSGVFLPDLSVPALAVPLDSRTPLQCCCANALDIHGGKLKVEGLTMLPPGRMFSFLCRICFGLVEFSEDDDSVDLSRMGPDGGPVPVEEQSDLLARCSRADQLNERSSELGEELVCEPSFVLDLLGVFDGFQSQELKPWPSLDENPFTRSNLRKARTSNGSRTPSNRKEESTIDKIRQSTPVFNSNHTGRSNGPGEGKSSKNENERAQQGAGQSTKTKHPTGRSISAQVNEQSRNYGNRRATQGTASNHSNRRSHTPIDENSFFLESSSNASTPISDSKKSQVLSKVSRLARRDPEQIAFPADTARLFVTDLEQGEVVGMDELPSPNILSLVMENYFISIKKKFEITFSGPNAHWILHRITDGPSEYYQGQFRSLNLSPSLDKDADGILPDWIKKKQARPTSLVDLLECVPATFSLKLLSGSFEGKAGVFFNSIDTAIRMECAAWLEAQFRVGSKHWYQSSIDDMVRMLHRG